MIYIVIDFLFIYIFFLDDELANPSAHHARRLTRVLFPVTTLSAVEPGSKGHNLVLKVVSSNVVVEKTRTDSSRVKIAEALVGDDTGVIVLTARNSMRPPYARHPVAPRP
jgi:hypothetical protein